MFSAQQDHYFSVGNCVLKVTVSGAVDFGTIVTCEWTNGDGIDNWSAEFITLSDLTTCRISSTQSIIKKDQHQFQKLIESLTN